MKMIRLAQNNANAELIATVESLGTWEKEVWNMDLEHSYDVWSWNGKYYRIQKDPRKFYNNLV